MEDSRRRLWCWRLGGRRGADLQARTRFTHLLYPLSPSFSISSLRHSHLPSPLTKQNHNIKTGQGHMKTGVDDKPPRFGKDSATLDKLQKALPAHAPQMHEPDEARTLARPSLRTESVPPLFLRDPPCLSPNRAREGQFPRRSKKGYKPRDFSLLPPRNRPAFHLVSLLLPKVTTFDHFSLSPERD